MPFITEEIWHQLKEREKGDDCIVAKISADISEAIKDVTATMEHILSVKSSVIDIRNQYQMSPKETIDLIHPADVTDLWNTPGTKSILKKLSNATVNTGDPSGVSFIAGLFKYFNGILEALLVKRTAKIRFDDFKKCTAEIIPYK